MFLKVLEWALIALAAILLLTQVLIPAYKGQRLFPLFRRQGKLEQKLADATQKQEEDKIEAKIEELEPKVVNLEGVKPKPKAKPRGRK